jgi:hypothetical protein
MQQTRVRGGNNTSLAPEEYVGRVLQQEQGTPWTFGGFESPTMASTEARSDPARRSAHIHTIGGRVRDSPTIASTEARSDPARGSAHIHTMGARVRDSPTMGSTEARSDPVRGKAQERAVRARMMLSPQRETIGHQTELGALGSGAHGLQALAQTVIAGKTVYLQGVKITPGQVAKFVDHKRVQLRSRVFLLAQLDADFDESAMAIIELKLEHFRAMLQRPGPWRKTWVVEYFLRKLTQCRRQKGSGAISWQISRSRYEWMPAMQESYLYRSRRCSW